jgi:hypothetical protein
MNDFERAVTDGMAAALDAVGVVVTIGSVDYVMIQSDATTTDALGVGGFLGDVDFVLHGLKAQFLTLPVAGDSVTICSVTYRIVSTSTSEGDPELRVSIKRETNKG